MERKGRKLWVIPLRESNNGEGGEKPKGGARRGQGIGGREMRER